MYKYHKDNRPNPDASQWDSQNRSWYEERNKQLLIDKQIKTYRELSDLYGLSISRLQELIDKQSNKFIGV